jgi:hypothetical protein
MFNKPEASNAAKVALNGQTFEDKAIVINNYEIKEIRQLQNEEEVDKKDWDTYIAQKKNVGLENIDLNDHQGLTNLIEGLMQTLSINQQQEK